MPLRLTNTLTGKEEEFRPLRSGRVCLYVCGVTVYDDCHIGHARGAVVFDVLRRYLEGRYGYQVKHVRNITDVDDKIIDRARTEAAGGRCPAGDLKAAAREVAARFEKSFQDDFARLALLPPTQEPRATEFIPKMIDFIQVLIKRDCAYEAPDGVYFSVRKLDSYGAFSHQSPDALKSGVRIEPGEGKRDPLDFALWKKAKMEEPSWQSPWGEGRPGWHIECSTMSTALLGDTFDIHGGGQDLIFPHHENERAQALGAGKGFAKIWLHNGLLTVNNQKMSKSLGNIIRIQDALAKHPADVLRLFYLSAHYRSPLDFSWERLDEAARRYEGLVTFLSYADALPPSDICIVDQIEDAEREFHDHMENDLNTPGALSCLDALQRYGNEWKKNFLRHDDVQAAKNKLIKLGGILGFFQTQDSSLDPQVKALILERDEARRRKDFTTSDRIRNELSEKGYIVEDTSGGTIVRKRI